MQMEGSAQEQRPCCHEPPLMDCGLGVNTPAENCAGSVDEGGTMAMFVLVRFGRFGIMGIKGFASGAIALVGSFSGIVGCLTGSGGCGRGGMAC